MENAFFVERSHGTANSPARANGGHVQNRLQELKEEIAQELLDEGPLCQSELDEIREDRVLAADSREIDWHYRSQLEARLRDIYDAQDRLLDGNYGTCIECGEPISAARITADPVVSLCLNCQSDKETGTIFHTL